MAKTVSFQRLSQKEMYRQESIYLIKLERNLKSLTGIAAAHFGIAKIGLSKIETENATREEIQSSIDEITSDFNGVCQTMANMVGMADYASTKIKLALKPVNDMFNELTTISTDILKNFPEETVAE